LFLISAVIDLMSSNSGSDPRNHYMVYERSSISMNSRYCPPQHLFDQPTHHWSSQPLSHPLSPQIWPQLDSNHDQYHRPCHGYSANVRTSHSANCCLSNRCDGWRQIQQFCNNYNRDQFECNASPSSSNSRPTIVPEFSGSTYGNRDESGLSEQNTVSGDGDQEVIDKKEQINQLKAINETLKLSLQETTNKLRDTHNSLLKVLVFFVIFICLSVFSIYVYVVYFYFQKYFRFLIKFDLSFSFNFKTF
jgi:hypothetical protein